MIEFRVLGRTFRFETPDLFRSFMVWSLAGLMIAMASFNADGYLRDGLYIMAALAVACECIGFASAIILEIQARKKRWLAVVIMAFTLIVCAVMNVAGGDRAWRASEQRRVEATLTLERHALDAAQKPWRDALARAQAALQAIPGPDCRGVGPNTCRSRTAAWQASPDAARAAAAGAAVAVSQRELNAHPLGEPAEVSPLVPSWSIDALLVCIEVIKLTGLWATGLELAPPNPAPTQRLPNMGQILNARRRDRPAFREQLLKEYGPEIRHLIQPKG